MRQEGHIDYPLFIVIFALVIFGLVMISSVSVFESYNITKQLAQNFPNQYPSPSNDFYLLRSLGHVAIALPVWFIVMRIPFTFWRKAAPFVFFVSIVLLLILFTHLGVNYKGATGWLNIPFLPSIQPVEIAKIGVVLYFARWLERRKEDLQSLENGFFPFLFILGIVVLLLILQPDFGSVLVVVPIAVVMYYIAGAKLTHLISGFIVAVLVTVMVVATVPHVRNRFSVFIDPSVDPKSRNIGWQIQQASIAIGSGGWLGAGFGKSIQKFGYLPEVQGDTIFSAMAEELGYVRMFLLLCAYLFIAYRGYRIAKNAPNRFSSLVAVGITTWFVWQSLVNIAVNIQLMPLTGITLPFISYGGSSLTTLLVAAGILLNISRYVGKETVVRRRGIRGPYYS
jgi:cell division protein FtsW